MFSTLIIAAAVALAPATSDSDCGKQAQESQDYMAMMMGEKGPDSHHHDADMIVEKGGSLPIEMAPAPFDEKSDGKSGAPQGQAVAMCNAHNPV